MKLSLAVITLLAGFAVALPQNKQNGNNNNNNNNNGGQNNQNGGDDAVNDAANDGSGGEAAAAKAEAAILLTENGDGMSLTHQGLSDNQDRVLLGKSKLTSLFSSSWRC